MPQAEKLKLKAESSRVEAAEAGPMPADHRILVRQIHQAYVRNFSMNKAKARLILAGKSGKPVNERWGTVWVLGYRRVWSPVETKRVQRSLKKFKKCEFLTSSFCRLCKFPQCGKNKSVGIL